MAQHEFVYSAARSLAAQGYGHVPEVHECVYCRYFVEKAGVPEAMTEECPVASALERNR